MKKTVFGVFAAFALIGMTSCGGGKTPQEIEAEAQKKFDAEKAKLEQEATAACDASKATRITTLRDSLVKVYNDTATIAPIVVAPTVQ